jgi:hypothetical protein
MRVFFIVVLAILIPLTSLKAQRYWTGSVGVNYGKYSMKSLEQLQQAIMISGDNIPLKIVEDFPSRTGFEASLAYSFGKFSLGGFLSKASTGSRASYADYSGSINHDLVANNTIIAVQVEGDLEKKENWEIFFSLRQGFAFNTTKYKTEVQVLNDTDKSEQSFKSINAILSPGFGGRIFYHNFFIHPEARYEWHFVKSDLHAEGDDEMYVEVNGRRFQSGWDGVRLCLNFGYRF